MSTALNQSTVSVAAYLAGEQDARHRHEYVAGFIYAMVGATNAHNRIATNATGELFSQLKGNPCQVFNSDTKIRIQSASGTRFYYPDASVVCRPNDDADTFQDAPVVIIEVLSRSTRRTDELEKRDAYLSIDSLKVYLLVEQSAARVVAWRRTETGFSCEEYSGIDATISLPEIDCELALSDLFENVQFVPEPGPDDEIGM